MLLIEYYKGKQTKEQGMGRICDKDEKYKL